MPDPFRLRVKKAVTNQIKTVTVANGYTVDLDDYTDIAGRSAARVFRGRDEFGDSDALPMVSVLEDPRPNGSRNATNGRSETAGVFRLLIQGFIEDDKDNPTDTADFLAADVITALVKAKGDKFNILGLGPTKPCITHMEIGQPVVRPADDTVSSVAFFFVQIDLTLVEDLEVPYT